MKHIREIGRVLWLAGLVGLALAQGADRVQVDIDPVFARHGVVAMGYNHAQFRATTSSIFGMDNAAAADPVLPYSILLKSSYASPIASVVLHYPRLKNDGRTVGVLQIFRFAGSMQGSAHTDGVLLTPDGQLNNSLNHLKSMKQYPITPQAAVAQSKPWFDDHFNSKAYSKVTVSLDSVMFEDGAVVGPDRFGIISLEQSKSSINRDFLTRFQDKTASAKELTEWLTARVDPAPGDGEDADSLVAQVALYRRGLAKMMLSALKNPKVDGKNGLVTFMETIISRATPKTESLRKLN